MAILPGEPGLTLQTIQTCTAPHPFLNHHQTPEGKIVTLFYVSSQTLGPRFLTI